MDTRTPLRYWAAIFALALAVGVTFMLGVQHLAEPLAERFLRSAHIPLRRPVFPPSTVTLLSHYAGIIGFLIVTAEGVKQGSAPVRRHH